MSKAGRPPLSPEDRHDTPLRVLLTAKERLALEALANGEPLAPTVRRLIAEQVSVKVAANG